METKDDLKNDGIPIILTSEECPDMLSPKEKEDGIKRTLIIQFDDEEPEEK